MHGLKKKKKTTEIKYNFLKLYRHRPPAKTKEYFKPFSLLPKKGKYFLNKNLEFFNFCIQCLENNLVCAV